jgi:hypothetical protein
MFRLSNRCTVFDDIRVPHHNKGGYTVFVGDFNLQSVRTRWGTDGGQERWVGAKRIGGWRGGSKQNEGTKQKITGTGPIRMMW